MLYTLYNYIKIIIYKFLYIYRLEIKIEKL